jgi:hypothetical protein
MEAQVVPILTSELDELHPLIHKYAASLSALCLRKFPAVIVSCVLAIVEIDDWSFSMNDHIMIRESLSPRSTTVKSKQSYSA